MSEIISSELFSQSFDSRITPHSIAAKNTAAQNANFVDYTPRGIGEERSFDQWLSFLPVTSAISPDSLAPTKSQSSSFLDFPHIANANSISHSYLENDSYLDAQDRTIDFHRNYVTNDRPIYKNSEHRSSNLEAAPSDRFDAKSNGQAEDQFAEQAENKTQQLMQNQKNKNDSSIKENQVSESKNSVVSEVKENFTSEENEKNLVKEKSVDVEKFIDVAKTEKQRRATATLNTAKDADFQEELSDLKPAMTSTSDADQKKGSPELLVKEKIFASKVSQSNHSTSEDMKDNDQNEETKAETMHTQQTLLRSIKEAAEKKTRAHNSKLDARTNVNIDSRSEAQNLSASSLSQLHPHATNMNSLPTNNIQTLLPHSSEFSQERLNAYRALIKGSFTQFRENGRSISTIRMFPAHLGNVTLHMQVQGMKVHASFSVENQSAKDLLLKDMYFIKEEMMRQQLSLENLNVHVRVQGDSLKSNEENQNQEKNFHENFMTTDLFSENEEQEKKTTDSQTESLMRNLDSVKDSEGAEVEAELDVVKQSESNPLYTMATAFSVFGSEAFNKEKNSSLLQWNVDIKG